MEVWLFGNPDLATDSLPLRLLPELAQQFPDVLFREIDPVEDIEPPDFLVIIDTVQGIQQVQQFTSLTQFTPPPSVTLHDFDAYTRLKLLEKLKKLPPFVLIGVPQEIDQQTAFKQISACLHSIVSSRSATRSSYMDRTRE